MAAGTGNLIYNGTYFYHRHGSNFLVRYNLENAEQYQSQDLGKLSHRDCGRKLDHTFEVKCNIIFFLIFLNSRNPKCNYYVFRCVMRLRETIGYMTDPITM